MSQWNRASNAIFWGLVSYGWNGDTRTAAWVIVGVFTILSIAEATYDALANRAKKTRTEG